MTLSYSTLLLKKLTAWFRPGLTNTLPNNFQAFFGHAAVTFASLDVASHKLLHAV